MVVFWSDRRAPFHLWPEVGARKHWPGLLCVGLTIALELDACLHIGPKRARANRRALVVVAHAHHNTASRARGCCIAASGRQGISFSARVDRLVTGVDYIRVAREGH